MTREFWEDLKTWIKRKHYRKLVHTSEPALVGLEKKVCLMKLLTWRY